MCWPERGERVTIVGATSGDTGCGGDRGLPRPRCQIEIFILHPEGRVSEVQRRQMTTVAAANVHNIAVQGTFDDCQDLVKAMFNDAAFREDELNLSAVNSINWARVMAQIAYYFAAASALGAPGSGGRLRRADRQLRQRLRRLCGARHGPAGRRLHGRLQHATTS